MKKLPWLIISLVATMGALQAFAGCGGDDSAVTTTDGGGEGGDDGTVGGGDGSPGDGGRADSATCHPQGSSCTTSADCCTANCQGGTCGAPNGCALPAAACFSGSQCCTGSCVSGACADKQCVADGLGCGTNTDCCSQTCGPDGKCAAIPNGGVCKTTGNPCAGNNDCCSKLCNAGLCSGGVSFCAQDNDICTSNFQCCTGNCTIAAGAPAGFCGGVPPAPGGTNCTVKGEVCSNIEAGAPTCGGTCCSRRCAPTGTSGPDFICQPPSGCAPTGELCKTDQDCCGADGTPNVDGPVHCSKGSPTQEFGRCDNGTKCREPGSTCKPNSYACSLENNCCDPIGASPGLCNSVATSDQCCKADSLGIPRCLVNLTCANPGGTCATSADCCNLTPCVGGKCQAACVNLNGACTTNADCCTGLPCVIPTGTSQGICGGTIQPDGGVTTTNPPPDAGPPPDSGTDSSVTPPPVCALYGQSCASTPCCNGIPCSGGICQFIQ